MVPDKVELHGAAADQREPGDAAVVQQVTIWGEGPVGEGGGGYCGGAPGDVAVVQRSAA